MNGSARKLGGGFGKRTRSWGASAFVAALLGAGCGDDAPASGTPDPVGTGGSAGSSGSVGSSGASGSAGSGGDGATGGGDSGADSSSGSGGGGAGGTGAAGGTGGTNGGTGGTGGGGDAGPCGNGTKDPGEQCDDSNTANGDGCSAWCADTARCGACDQTYCKGAADGDYDYAVDKCANDTTPASDGPAAGRKKNELCTELLACVRNSNCAALGTNVTEQRQDCYCGSLGPQECIAAGAKPNGPCIKELEAAGESRVKDVLDSRATGGAFALGLVGIITQVCDGMTCKRECHTGAPSDDCYRCSLGPGAITLQPTCRTLPNCYGQHATVCPAVVDCARQTGCAASGAASCYGNGSGPCATQIAAAAGTTDPAEVVARLSNAALPAGEIALLIECQATECTTACLGTDGG
jgi:cysteine-rich repeat protein